MWLLAGVTVLITYGSLYPFDFTRIPAAETAWASFFSDPRMPRSLGDILGNAALFAPFGFAGLVSLPLRTSSRILVTLVAALALATGLQALQLYLPSRTPALGDALWNMVGTALGAALAEVWLRRNADVPRLIASLPAALVVLWVASELIPFVPSLDWQGMKEAIKPLADARLPVGALGLHAAGVLLAGEAIGRMMSPGRTFLAMAMLTAGVVVGKLIVVTQHLDLSVLGGLAAGWALWLIARAWSDTRRSVVLVATLMFAYVIAALAPFEFVDSPNTFSWVPFAGLLRGSMLDNTRALVTSGLIFAGVAWVARDAGGSARAAGVAVGCIALILELVQTYIRGRSPDVTEPLLAVICGLTVHAWPSSTERYRRRGPTSPAASASVDAKPDVPESESGWVRWGLRLLLACTAIAVPIMIVLRLPGIPYNVAELFRASGSFPVLLVFALALLWIGAAPVVIGDWISADPRRDWFLPVLAFGAGLVSLFLLWLSATEESISDIDGSSNVYWFVTNKDMWGVWARQAFLASGSPGLIGFIERCVRHAALYGPVVTFPAFMFLVLDARSTSTLSTRRVATWLLPGALWLWLCKGIAFDWSSTDNLNELITRDGRYGLGGGGYLYLLLALISANFVALTRAPLRPGSIAVGATITVLLVPVGWWLLTHGLEPRVEKYGAVFSGTQFLLGPDRKQLLSEEALFLRWSVVQLGAIAIAVAGARLACKLPVSRGRRGASSALKPRAGSRPAIRGTPRP